MIQVPEKDIAPFDLQSVLADPNSTANEAPIVQAMCDLRGYDLADLLANQFIMSSRGFDLPLTRRSAFGVHVGFGKHLDFCRVSIDGTKVAVFVGKGYNAQGPIIRDVNITPRRPGSSPQAVLESWISWVSGTFAVLAKFDDQRFVYTDPTGAVGGVFDPVTYTLASTLFLALRRPFVPNPIMCNLAEPLFDQKPILGQTHDAVAVRLNPSCRLNLDTTVQERIWPNSASELNGSPKAAVNTLTLEAQKIAKAMPLDDVRLAFSGGIDSRIVASFFADRPDLKCFSHVNNYANRLDVELAQWVASDMGKPLDIYRKKKAKPDASLPEKFFIASGGCTNVPDEYENGVVNLMPTGKVILRGQQIDILRAVQTIRPKGNWQEWWRIKELLPVDRDAWKRDVYNQYLRLFAGWYDSATDYMEDRLPDIDLIELYNPASNGFRFPGMWHNIYVSLFNNRRLIDMMLLLSVEDRKSLRPVFQILQHNCPQIMHIPFMFELTKPDLDFISGKSLDFETYAKKYIPRVA